MLSIMIIILFYKEIKKSIRNWTIRDFEEISVAVC